MGRDPSSLTPGPATETWPTLAFLFTDIEGSTRLWDAHPEQMQVALQLHDAVMRDAIEAQGGIVFKTVGDAFCAVFNDGFAAVAAAIEAQRKLSAAPWPQRTGRIKVRMGIHVGPAECRDDDYFGPTLNRVARLSSLAYGDQILVSKATLEAVESERGAAYRDLGVHRLKDLSIPEQLFQVTAEGLLDDFPELKSLDAKKNNLPAPPSTFVGRDGEVAQLTQLLAQNRLVTVIGTGGVGKTRLSIHVAAECSDDFSDGTWFIDLAGTQDERFVVPIIAKTLAVRERPNETLLETLCTVLSEKSLLLVIDNCEHLVNAVAEFAATVLPRTHLLKILATSREALAISGEQRYQLLPFEDEPAAALFIERARQLDHGFSPSSSERASISEICRRVDYLALGIELAAARVRMLSISDLLRSITDGLQSLVDKRRVVAPRQRTLDALVEWSYRQLTENERLLFRRLAIFSGRWSIEAVKAVCVDQHLHGSIVAETLESLVEKSLVTREATETTHLFRLLETTLVFVRSRLLATTERYGMAREVRGVAAEQSTQSEYAQLTANHLLYYRSKAEKLDAQLNGVGHATAMREFDLELDNFRAALDRALEHPALVRSGAELAKHLGRFWMGSGAVLESEFWHTKFLERVGVEDTSVVGALFYRLGEANIHSAKYDQAAQAFAAAARNSDLESQANGIYGLGQIDRIHGELERARERLDDALGRFRALGDLRSVAVVATELCNVFLLSGDRAQAREMAELTLSTFTSLGHERGIAIATGNLAAFALASGDYQRSLELHRGAARCCHDLGDMLNYAWFAAGVAESLLFLGDTTVGDALDEALNVAQSAGYRRARARCIETLGAVWGMRGDVERGTELLGFAAAEYARIGLTLDEDDRLLHERKLEIASRGLSAEGRLRALGKGKLLPAETEFSVHDAAPERSL